MIEPFIAVIGALGVAAGLLGGVIGFGTTIILTPALVYHYGALQTVPIVAVVATVANASRIAIWWREIDWRLAGAYSAGAVPAVVLGAHTLVHLPERWVGIALGAFLLALVPIRRWLRTRSWRMHGWQMTLAGAGIGYLTGIVATTGPISTPFFLSAGLLKGTFLGTEAAGSLAIFITKALVFSRLGVIDAAAVAQGLWIGACVFAGSLLSRRVVLALPETVFLRLMEAVMLVSGLSILWMYLG